MFLDNFYLQIKDIYYETNYKICYDEEENPTHISLFGNNNKFFCYNNNEKEFFLLFEYSRYKYCHRIVIFHK